jgi:DNA-binding response OmpR family regulator
MVHIKPAENCNILIVDDCSMILTVVSAMLAANGFEKIFTLANKKAAIEHINSADFPSCDLMILDRHLGRESGLDVLSALRRNRNDTPVIMLTQEDNAAMVIEAIAAGASDYIVKPFTEELLVTKVRRALGLPQPETWTMKTAV